ncbi:MAG: hypothetical protein KDC79_16790 [Cyclobacteriaceae bacterium]|nr:hypothetical protein [Cyclobacteriaceae bacterium]
MKTINNSIIALFLLSFFACDNHNPSPLFTSLDSLYVHINTPKNGTILIPGDTAKFEATVYGDTLLPTKGLRAVWKSSIDGILYEGEINSDFKTLFETDGLSKNIHIVTLNIYNEIDSIISDDVLVYNIIKLDTFNRTDNSLSFKWSKVNLDSASGYNLYRSRDNYTITEDDLLFTTMNVNDTVYKDTTAIMGYEYHYQVRVLFNEDLRIPSNILFVRPGIYNDLDFPLLKIQVDRERDLIYGVVAPKDLNDELDEYGIAIIDGENLQILHRILNSERLVDIDISPDNKYLFAATRNRIFKIDLNNLNEVSSMTVNNPINGIEVGKNNRLYYHIFPGQYCSCDSEFRIVDTENNKVLPFITEIGAAYADYYKGEFTIDPETNTVYHGNDLSSPTLVKFSTNNDIFSDQIRKGGWSNTSKYIFYNNGKVFWDYALYDSNLERIGTFTKNGNEVTILDASPDGTLALGWGGLFKIIDQSHYKNVPVPTERAKFINNHRLIIYSNNYSKPQSVIYRYSF